MAKFNLVAQLQLQSPNNAAQIARQLKKQFGAIGVPINIQTNTRQIKAASTAIGLVNTELKNTNRSAKDLGQTLGIAARRFGAISIATGTFLSLTRAVKNSLKEAIAFEREMNKIRQVTGKTADSIKEISDEITSLSKGLGVSANQLALTARTLAQAGFSAEAASKSLNILAQTDLAPTFDTIEDTTEGAIAILQQFGKEAIKTSTEAEFLEKSLDAINSVSKSFAVESADLITAVRKTGGSFEAAGGSLNELLALFTSVRATTRESADTIAVAFRTIFTRLQRSETIDALKELGIELQDVEGKFVGPLEAIQRLSASLSVLDTKDFRFSQIVENLGGFRQIGKVIPLLKQFTITQEALNVAQKSSGSIAKDTAVAQDALQVQISKVREEFDALIRKFSESDTFKSVVSDALKLAQAFIKVGEALEPLLPLVTALVSIKLGSTLVGAFKGLTGNTKRFAGGGKVHKFAQGGLVPGVGNTDSVPSLLQPGEFVLRKSAVDHWGLNNVQKFATGGIVTQNEVGALVLDSDKIVKPYRNTADITISPKDFKEPNIAKTAGLVNAKTYGLKTFGIDESIQDGLSKTIRSNLIEGLAESINKTATQFKPELDIREPVVLREFKDKFVSSIGEGTIGSLFEAMLSSIQDPRFDNAANQSRPFDFVGSLGGARKLFPNQAESIKYRDAKISLAAATTKSFKKKIRDQITLEALGLRGFEEKGSQSVLQRELRSKGPLNTRELAEFLKSQGFTGEQTKSGKNIASTLSRAGIEFTREDLGSGKGFVYKFKDGGEVPSLVMPGEYIFSEKDAKKIGYHTLNRMNKFADGGYVGGSGNKDNVPAMLEEGQFVLRKAAVERFAKGGKKFANSTHEDSFIGALDSVLPFNKISTSEIAGILGTATNASSNVTTVAPGGAASELIRQEQLRAQTLAENNKLLKEQESYILKSISDQKALNTQLGETVDDYKIHQKALQEASIKYGGLHEELQAELDSYRPSEQTGAQKSSFGSKLLSKFKLKDQNVGLSPSEVAAKSKKTADDIGRLSQNFLFMGGAITAVVSQFGLLSDETSDLVTQMSATVASFVGIGGTILDGVSGPLSKLDGKLSANTDKFSKAISKMGGVVNIASGALAGFAAGMAVVQYITAQTQKQIDSQNKKAADEVTKAGESGTGNAKAAAEARLEAARLRKVKANQGTGGAIGAGTGALAGAAAGAAFGSAVPIVGTAIGAVGGAIIGGTLGGLGGATAGEKLTSDVADPSVQAITKFSEAQIGAINATTKFSKSLDLIAAKNLSAGEAALQTAKVADLFGADLLKAKKAAAEASAALQGNKKATEEEKKLQEETAEQVKIAQAKLREATLQIGNNLTSSVGAKLSSGDLNITRNAAGQVDVGSLIQQAGLGPALQEFKDGLYATSESGEEVAAQMSGLYNAISDAAEQSQKMKQQQEALKAAYDAQLKTTLQLNAANRGLQDGAQYLSNISSNMERFFSSNLVIKDIDFGDLSKVGNIEEFGRKAQEAGQLLGATGAQFATQLTSSVDAIKQFETGAQKFQNDLKAAGGTALEGDAGQQRISELLGQFIGKDTFAGLGPNIQKELIGIIQSAGGDFNQGTIDSVIGVLNKQASGFAEVLSNSSKLSNEAITTYIGGVNQLIAAQNQEIQLRQSLVDVQSRGLDRLEKAYGDRASSSDVNAVRDQLRTRRAQIGLAGTGVQAGNVGSAAGALSNIQNTINRNKQALGGPLSIETRGRLEKENAKLADQAAKVTNELERLADQSDKASEILGEIDKERAKREFATGQVKDFILGSREERASQIRTYQGANVVARTGSFQSLPEEMRKSVSGLLDQLAELQPGGIADQVRRTALFNDARAAGIPPALAKQLADSQATSKEQKLINELKSISMQEQAAQMALINSQQQQNQLMAQILPTLNEVLTELRNRLIAEQGSQQKIQQEQAARGITNEQVNQLETQRREKEEQAKQQFRNQRDAQFTQEGQAGIDSYSGEVVAQAAQDFANAAAAAMIAAIKQQQIDTVRTPGFTPTPAVNKANGGSIFKPRGTDTVPAMLTPGEYVIQKSAVDKYGPGMMESINSGHFARGGSVKKTLTQNQMGFIGQIYSGLMQQSQRATPAEMVQSIAKGMKNIREEFPDSEYFDNRVKRIYAQLNAYRERYAAVASRMNKPTRRQELEQHKARRADYIARRNADYKLQGEKYRKEHVRRGIDENYEASQRQIQYIKDNNVGVRRMRKGGVVYRQTGGSIPSGGLDFNQFSESMNNIIQTMSQNFDKLAQSLTGITMTHEVNVNGQLAIAGLNVPEISNQIKQSIGQYIADAVGKHFELQNSKFKAG